MVEGKEERETQKLKTSSDHSDLKYRDECYMETVVVGNHINLRSSRLQIGRTLLTLPQERKIRDLNDDVLLRY